MKKSSVLFFFALIFGMVLTSCSNDGANVDMSLIEGKWNFNQTSFTQSVITTPKTDYQGNEVGCNKDYIEIIAGGVVKAGDYTTACAFVESTGTWTASGNSITVIVSGTDLTGTFEVASVSATELILKIKTTQSGVTVTVNQTFTKA